MMTAMILMTTSLALNMFMMLSPLSMGISILFMALMVALLFAYSMSSWIAFLIFLIYIGGMMVMFSYFVSLIPNQTINMMSIMLMMMFTFITLNIMMYIMMMNIHMPSLYDPQMSMFYMKFNSPTLMLLASILLITMIIVVKLTISSKGPLRPFNQYV